MRRGVCLVVAALALAGCGSSGGGGNGAEPVTHQNYTSVEVNGNPIAVREVTLYGYTCLVGTEESYYDDFSPAIWCDERSVVAPTPAAVP